jgi:uncharacterized protein YjbJ (UPF0337 family)
MDKTQLESRWPQIRGRVKANWNRLTDEDLDKVNGDPDTLISVIEEKYQEPRISIEVQLAQLLVA